jgi:preprotein translocase subunit SecF
MFGIKLYDTNIRFMRYQKLWMWMSLIITTICLVGIGVKGFNFGIDFTGGLAVEVSYQQPVELEPIRTALANNGFEQAIVQHFGSTHDVMIRAAAQPGVSAKDLTEKMVSVIAQGDNASTIKRTEFVGPQVGDELASDGVMALLAAFIIITIYVALRYEVRFSLGAILGVLHDATIVAGLFAWFGWLVDLSVLAALLAVIGYSINDTIVVFDRVRENFRTQRGYSPAQVMDSALNQTLSRTTMTSFVTLLVVVVLFFTGGEALHLFSLAMIIGIVAGTYSSIYVASSLALGLGITQEDLVRKDKGKDKQSVEEELKADFLRKEQARGVA